MMADDIKPIFSTDLGPGQCGNPGCSCMDPDETRPPNPGFRIALVVALVLSALVVCSRACAQESMTLRGEPGVWLPLELARPALAAYEEGPRLHERLRLLDRALELRTAETVELRAGLAEAEREAHEARRALDLVRDARDAATRRARRRLGLAVGGGGLALVAGFLVGLSVH